MPSQKRSRLLRKQHARAARRPTDERRVAMRAAAHERDAALAKLRLEYQNKIDELYVLWAEKRQEVWADYDARATLIGQAHILTPASAES